MAITRLEPLTDARANELSDMLREVQQDESKGLSLDDQGRVTGTVYVDEKTLQHVVGDFDVHA